MLRRRTCFGALLVVVLSQSVALAGEATPEGAKKLQETFQKYLGAAAGEGGSLSIKPEGEAYLVSFDIENAVKPFSKNGGPKMEPAVVSFHVADQGDGTYKVSDLKLPSLIMSVKQMKLAYTFDGTSFEGIFDPKIAGFTTAQTKFGKIGYEQIGPDAAVKVAEIDINGDQKGTAVAPGVATIKQHLTIGSLTEEIAKSATGDSNKIKVDFGATTADIGIDALHSQAIWDIWAFFVAHSKDPAGPANTAELKGLLSALLPVFDKLDEDVKFTNMGVDTPMGRFSIGEFGFKIATSGAVAQGTYGLTLSAGKPGVPQGMLKPWQEKLLPTTFSIGATMTGLNLEAGAKQLIGDLDLAAKDPVPASSLQKAGDAIWSSGPLKVTISPSHIDAPSYQVQMSGDATINRAGPPSLHVLVSAKGLDETMAALNSAKQEDPVAGQAVLMLATAKGLGKPGADGTLLWEVNVGPDGAPTINGAKLGGP